MGFIAIDSPYSHLAAPPGVLTYATLQDTMWRVTVEDMGACERRGAFWLMLMGVRKEDLARCYMAYSYEMARWEFSPDVDPDQVTVRFLMQGVPYEIPALDPAELVRDRRPRQVPRLPAPSGPAGHPADPDAAHHSR